MRSDNQTFYQGRQLLTSIPYTVRLVHLIGAAHSVNRHNAKIRKTLRRSAIVKPSIKAVNYLHLFTTRCAIEPEILKRLVSYGTFSEPTRREDARKTFKKVDNETFPQLRQLFTSISYAIHIRLGSLQRVCVFRHIQ
jgi:hypothetical protein